MITEHEDDDNTKLVDVYYPKCEKCKHSDCIYVIMKMERYCDYECEEGLC